MEKLAHMDASTFIDGHRIYQDFIPPHELVQEEAADNLIVGLPGFRKEHIKVQIDNYGKLRISGARPLLGNRWSRFRKEFQVPENCNSAEIRARFENDQILITLPKFITEENAQDRPAHPSQKPMADDNKKEARAEPKPSTGPEDEKKSESSDAARDAHKTEERKMDPETKDKWKDAEDSFKNKIEREESSDGKADPGKKKEASKPPEVDAGRKRMVDERHELCGSRWSFLYKPKQSMWSAVAAVAVVVVSVSLGLYYYYNYKTSRPTESAE